MVIVETGRAAGRFANPPHGRADDTGAEVRCRLWQQLDRGRSIAGQLDPGIIDMRAMPGSWKSVTIVAASMALAAMLSSCLPERPPPPVEQTYKQAAGPHSVCQETHVWHDLDRLRDIPVRIYRPQDAEGPFPVIVFSHGLGLSRDHYTYLGRHWASHGYVAVYLTHPGSDGNAIKHGRGWFTSVLRVIEDMSNRINRPLDVSFALDQLERERGLGEVLDLDRIAVAGHSFGAFTAMATIGLQFAVQDGPVVGFADPRVKAVVAMSPQIAGTFGLSNESWGQLQAPCMTMMGTRDLDPVTYDARQRRAAFENASGPDQYLVTLEDANHYTFDDKDLLAPDLLKSKPFHEYIQMVSIAFFDAYLNDDPEAQRWLRQRSLEECSSGSCHLEYKNVTEIE